MTTLLVVVLILALCAEFLNGATDAGNAIATVVSTRVLRPFPAVIMAAILNFAGAMAGTKVAMTIAKGFVDPSADMPLYAVGAAMCAILIWGTLAWWFGMPISKSHALVSGLTGAALAVVGREMLLADGWKKVGLGLLISTFVGFGLGHTIIVAILHVCRRVSPSTVRRVFGRLQLLSAAYMAFEHGRNDGQKFMGVMVLAVTLEVTAQPTLLVNDPRDTNLQRGSWVTAKQAESAIATAASAGKTQKPMIEISDVPLPWWSIRMEVVDPGSTHLQASDRISPQELRLVIMMLKQGQKKPETKPVVPIWVIGICAMTMGLGTSLGGWRVIKTMGLRLVRLEPYQGFAAETAAATAIGIASEFYIPLSTTHTINTSIMGVGASKRLSAVRWGVAGNIVSAWALTFPACIVLGYMIARIMLPFF